ncbi:MAG: DNA gyrase subunit A [Saprospiraceae bacterium]|nr:DNA gyrase subunit A [Saprospiraceae bacterium]MBK9221645.1 DNA gyrase subunit A [Saprospiraceae bacterium]MBK9728481.1 DNA gyrase subunit A [Saprospiraceae bacterium]
MSEHDKIIPVSIEKQLQSSYIDYSMSVIVARALPDVRDGLKPVHRRVMYGMSGLGLGYNKSYKKSARIVGEVLGKYHPHGDSSVYDAMVRMAQEWSMRYPLVDGQGNFGSMDGDSPAAMRYTEARLSRISDELLDDIDKETVDFRLNFDDSLEEPTVLPSKVPNLLINGSSGIAVGMATNMLPHNLVEVCDGVIRMIDNPEVDLEELMTIIPGPDLPTGGTIYGISGIKDAYETGKGKIIVRGKAEIQVNDNREFILISEIPYQVNKALMIQKIADLVNEEKITGISDVRDESDRDGIRVIIELKKDAISSVVLSNIYKYSPLQTSFGINNIALVQGRPVSLGLKDLIREFIKFRLEVVIRRTNYELKIAKEKAHILEGLLIAIDHLDEVIKLIRASRTVEDARTGLMSQFQLSEIQAKAILDMRLQKLTGLEREKIKEEYDALLLEIARLELILGDESLRRTIIKDELEVIKQKFGDPRRTDITHAEGDINMEDIIANDQVVVTISHQGYIKRTKSSEYRTQSRGGRGSTGSKTREEDFIEHMFIASNHNYLLLFTELGKCFWLRVYEIPEAAKTNLGRAIQNIINLPKEDKVRAYINIQNLEDREFLDSHFIMLCTKKGTIKKSSVNDFSRPRSNGIIAISINEGDQLMEAKLTNGQSEIVIANRKGRAIRFSESKVRTMGRNAAGVRAIRLESTGDQVVGMVCIDPSDTESTILVVSEKGNGKRTDINDYSVTNRGGKGVKTLKLTDKTGALVAIKNVTEQQDLMITTTQGVIIRMHVSDLRVMGRATQGVRLIRLDEGDEIADVAVIDREEEVIEDVEIIVPPIIGDESEE